jgi:anti-sigma B factor antagonist
MTVDRSRSNKRATRGEEPHAVDGFRVETEDDGVVHRLRLIGELDAATVEVLRSAVSEAMGNGAERVVLDLGELDFVDSTGLGALIGALKRMRESGGELALTAVRPRVVKLLELTGLDKVFTIG